MGLLSNAIDRRKLKPGDHIYCYRNAHTYSHHGIYVDDDRVIHFRRTQKDSTPSSSNYQACRNCGFQPETQRGVVKSCLDCFLKRDKLFLFEYKVRSSLFKLKKSGSCSTTSSDTQDVVLRRATEMLNTELGFGNYDFMENNCECFARFCKTGVSKSLQAFSLKAKFKLLFRSVTEESFSLESAFSSFARVIIMREHMNDTLHYDQNQSSSRP